MKQNKLLSSLFCLIQHYITFACNRDTEMFHVYMYILCANGFADIEVGRFVPSYELLRRIVL